jgi:hypothetical protein
VTERQILILCFGLGVALESLFLIRRDWNWKRLLGCAALGTMGLVPGRSEHVYQPLLHLLLYFSAFSIAFAYLFRQDLLPAINERILLFYSILLWFAFLGYFYHGAPWQVAGLAVLALPVAILLLLAFRPTALNTAWKIVFYAWFLTVIVLLGLFQFPYHHLTLFLDDHVVPWSTPVDSVAAGMSFLFLAMNASYIFYLIPMRDRGETWAQRMKTWHAFTDLMAQRFDASQSTHQQALVILCAESAVLAFNHYTQFLSIGLLVNLLIIVPSLLLLYRPTIAASPAPLPAAQMMDPPHGSHRRTRPRQAQ